MVRLGRIQRSVSRRTAQNDPLHIRLQTLIGTEMGPISSHAGRPRPAPVSYRTRLGVLDDTQGRNDRRNFGDLHWLSPPSLVWPDASRQGESHAKEKN